MKKALVVGGNSGIGLALTMQMLKTEYDFVYVVGKDPIKIEDIPSAYEPFLEKISFIKANLIIEDFSVFDEINDIDTLMITAGFGRIAPFEYLCEEEISNIVKCNELAIIRIVKKYYERIRSDNDFYCAIMGSIAGHIASPLYSVYGASKAGLCAFIENINAELYSIGLKNRILDVSPGAIKGTRFHEDKTNLEALTKLATEILERTKNRELLYIPMYNEVYKNVLTKYSSNAMEFARESYEYKKSKISKIPQMTIGYLSGTFDLFHVGHLNLLRRAKEQCDYLIVGVHKSGSWKGKETFISFEDRKNIVAGIRYVNEVVESCTEDSDAWQKYHFDKLFVGSDYKGTERFIRYEEFFKDKNVEIVYFPYTQSISSTQLRNKISKQEG